MKFAYIYRMEINQQYFRPLLPWVKIESTSLNISDSMLYLVDRYIGVGLTRGLFTVIPDNIFKKRVLRIIRNCKEMLALWLKKKVVQLTQLQKAQSLIIVHIWILGNGNIILILEESRTALILLFDQIYAMLSPSASYICAHTAHRYVFKIDQR